MNKFDQHIKDKLSQQQVPPFDAWKNIEKGLDEKKEKKRIVPLFYWVGSTAACLILGVGVFYFAQNDAQLPHNTPQIVNQPSNQSKNKTNDKEDVIHTNQENNHNQPNRIEEPLAPYFKETQNTEGSSTFYSTKVQSKLNQPDVNVIYQELNSEDSHPSNFKNILGNEYNIAPKKSTELEEIKEKIVEEKSLELVIEENKKKKEEKIEVKKSAPIFAVSSFVSPSKMLESKSILSDQFNENNINNSVTMAYGAKVTVKVNDRLNVRSGISKIDMEQHTTNITAGVPSSSIISLSAQTNYSNRANNIAYNSNIRVFNQSDSHNQFTVFETENSTMEQKVQYIEVPLEIEYRLLNFNKFNLLATGGGSYYLLTKNTLSMSANNSKSTQKIGEATNLNNNSYSANAGLKLEYNLSPKTNINLEPNYRYMINPLDNVSSKNPSLLGLNLGFSIKF